MDEESGVFKNLKTFRHPYIQKREINKLKEIKLPDFLLIIFEKENFRIFLHSDDKWNYICKTRDHTILKCINVQEEYQTFNS